MPAFLGFSLSPAASGRGEGPAAAAVGLFPESACEGFFVKKQPSYLYTSSHLHICWSTSSHLHICWSTSSHSHICWSTSSHLHICWSTSSHLHICWSTSSHPHTCWSTSSHLHICWSTSSHLLIYIFTPSHLLIYIFTPSHLLIYIFRLQKSCQLEVPKTNPKLAPCTCLSWSWQSFPVCYVDERGMVFSNACNRGASRLGEAWPRPRLGRKTHWHKDKARLTGTRNYIILLLKSQQGWTWSSWQLCCLTRILCRSWRRLTSADLHLHTFTSADLHLHTLTSADLHLHTFTSSVALLSISLLRRGRCRRSATKRNPFARNGRWTSKTEVKLRF